MQHLGGYVYLLHYHQPISDHHTARHYIGWAYHLSSRIDQHLRGRGAKFTRVAHQRGITFELAAVWPGSRSYERQIKNKKLGWRLCPVCRQARQAAKRPAGQLVLDLDPLDDLL